MDPLSDVLTLLKPRSSKCGGLDVGGAVSIRFPAQAGVRCYALISGRGWLAVDGVAEPVPLDAGDCFLLPRGVAFRLASDLAAPPVAFETVFATPQNGGIRAWNGGGDALMFAGHFDVGGPQAELLLRVLPPIVHVRGESDKALLRWYLEQMLREVREQKPGGSLIAQHLAHMILVLAVRLHLADESSGGVGWLYALGDTEIGGTIAAMHDAPAYRWTLPELARHAAMSRSTFALKFKATAGMSPMEYLTRWRMLLAEDRLANSGDSVAEIALALGYDSESAFSTAFKRITGSSPRQFSRDRNPERVAV